MPGPITVMSALRAEIETLLDEMSNATTEAIAERQAIIGDLDGHEVVLVPAGIGKVNTGATVGATWERYRPRIVVFSGVAGGLDPRLHIGDVVIGDRTIQHDAGVIEPEGLRRYQAGHVPFFNPTDRLGFTPSAGLLDRVTRRVKELKLDSVMGRQPRVVVGTILTGDQYIHDETTRDQLYAEMGAAAVEMEGGALAQAAGELGIDHLVIRSLSDRAGSNAITDFGKFLGEVATNSARVVRHLLPVF